MNLSKSALESINHIVVHGNCPDGLASAILAKDAIPGAKVSFVQHHTAPYDGLPAEPGMLFIDITPPSSRLKEFRAVGALVLDHHERMQDIVTSFDGGIYEATISGAEMAFKYLWKPVKADQADAEEIRRASTFAELAGIRDLWRNKDPRWTEACAQAACLTFYSSTDWLAIDAPFGASHVDMWLNRMTVGRTVSLQRMEAARKSAERALILPLTGGKKLAILAGNNISDAAEFIGKTVDVLASFSYKIENQKGLLVVSMRSHADVDVARIAAHHGGGGHRRAAGFSVPFDVSDSGEATLVATLNPFTLLRVLVEQGMSATEDSSC